MEREKTTKSCAECHDHGRHKPQREGWVKERFPSLGRQGRLLAGGVVQEKTTQTLPGYPCRVASERRVWRQEGGGPRGALETYPIPKSRQTEHSYEQRKRQDDHDHSSSLSLIKMRGRKSGVLWPRVCGTFVNNLREAGPDADSVRRLTAHTIEDITTFWTSWYVALRNRKPASFLYPYPGPPTFQPDFVYGMILC